MLLFLYTGGPVVIAAEPPAGEAAVELEEDEEFDGDDADDGSAALLNAVRSIPPADLRPIDLSEEKALLGDWGDSANEDED
jgi:hypothetical protein